jgi:hypothetical protein
MYSVHRLGETKPRTVSLMVEKRFALDSEDQVTARFARDVNKYELPAAHPRILSHRPQYPGIETDDPVTFTQLEEHRASRFWQRPGEGRIVPHRAVWFAMN